MQDETLTEIIINVNEYRRGIWNATDLYNELTQLDRLNQLKQVSLVFFILIYINIKYYIILDS